MRLQRSRVHGSVSLHAASLVQQPPVRRCCTCSWRSRRRRYRRRRRHSRRSARSNPRSRGSCSPLPGAQVSVVHGSLSSQSSSRVQHAGIGSDSQVCEAAAVADLDAGRRLAALVGRVATTGDRSRAALVSAEVAGVAGAGVFVLDTRRRSGSSWRPRRRSTCCRCRYRWCTGSCRRTPPPSYSRRARTRRSPGSLPGVAARERSSPRCRPWSSCTRGRARRSTTRTSSSKRPSRS